MHGDTGDIACDDYHRVDEDIMRVTTMDWLVHPGGLYELLIRQRRIPKRSAGSFAEVARTNSIPAE